MMTIHVTSAGVNDLDAVKIEIPAELEKFFAYAAAHGLALFPIPFGFKEDIGWKKQERDKDPNLRPIVWRWSQDYSKDRATWEALYAAHRCNFGIYAAGSRCIVLDLDVAKDREVWTKYCEYWTSRGLTPPTPQFMSARKGYHVLIKVPDDFDLSALEQAPLMHALDTRIEGYIVAPGSYYDGTPKGEASGWYQMLADAAAPHNIELVFNVLAQQLARSAKKTKTKSAKAPHIEQPVDFSNVATVDEVLARVEHAYNVGPCRQGVLDPNAHASNPDPEDRARRERNGYFSEFNEWAPVVRAISALYGGAVNQTRFAVTLNRGREHTSYFEDQWGAGPKTPHDIAVASIQKFIGASNGLGFKDGGASQARAQASSTAKMKQEWQGLAAGLQGMPAAPEASEQPADTAKLIKSAAEFVRDFVPPDYLIDRMFQRGYVQRDSQGWHRQNCHCPSNCCACRHRSTAIRSGCRERNGSHLRG